MQEVDASEIDRRLRRESANLTGDVRISLMWSTTDDLDLHVITPGLERISYSRKSSSCGGCLDVDMNRDQRTARSDPVENIYWPVGRAPIGKYQVQVNLYARHYYDYGPVHFQVRVENRGSTSWFTGAVSCPGESVTITEFQSNRSLLPLPLDLGPLFQGSFSLKLEILDVEDRAKMRSFVDMLCSSVGALSNSQLTPEQYSDLPRLRKMLERMDDAQNFAGERHNAARVLRSCLEKLQWNEDSLRSACGGLSGKDVDKPTLATLTFSKKVTSRREWFEENANAISHPMGVTVTVNKASGHFGRTGHNGVSLIGKPAACILAATIIAKTSEVAMRSCTKSDVDSFCGNFCRQIRPVDESDANARSTELRRSRELLETRFSAKCASADYNTPKKFRCDTPTAYLGIQTGEKRKADFEHEAALTTKHHVRALGW